MQSAEAIANVLFYIMYALEQNRKEVLYTHVPRATWVRQ